MRFWIERFTEHKQAGLEALRKGDHPKARHDLLRASQLRFQIAKKTPPGQIREGRIRNAKKLLELAKKIDVRAEPSGKPDARRAEPAGEKDEEAKRWVCSKKPGVYFEDIAGLEETKETLRRRVVYPFLYPEVAQRSAG